MIENTFERPASVVSLQRLNDLRHTLLKLHKILLDAERDAYEQVNGQVKGGELLQLVINHEQFAWLHPISQLIVQIDELQDAKEPSTTAEVKSLLNQTRTLLTPTEDEPGFGQKYFMALQRSPDAIFANKEVRAILSAQE